VQRIEAIHAPMSSHKSGKANIRFSKRSYYYHAVPELGIDGYRDCAKRLKSCHVDEAFLKGNKVLDIGSNMGMVSLECAKHADYVCGIETSIGYVEISNILKDYLGRDNATFMNQSFLDHAKETDVKYDVILAFAVSNWVGVDVTEFMKLCADILADDGVVLFETHRSKNGKKERRAISAAGFDLKEFALIEKRRHVFECTKGWDVYRC